MQRCPHCQASINIRELPYQGLFNSYRICPACGGSFCVDTDTKYRQALFIIVALISLTFTVFLYFNSTGWLIPALVSYLALALLIWWGNRKVYFVPYRKNKKQ